MSPPAGLLVASDKLQLEIVTVMNCCCGMFWSGVEPMILSCNFWNLMRNIVSRCRHTDLTMCFSIIGSHFFLMCPFA